MNNNGADSFRCSGCIVVLNWWIQWGTVDKQHRMWDSTGLARNGSGNWRCDDYSIIGKSWMVSKDNQDLSVVYMSVWNPCNNCGIYMLKARGSQIVGLSLGCGCHLLLWSRRHYVKWLVLCSCSCGRQHECSLRWRRSSFKPLMPADGWSWKIADAEDNCNVGQLLQMDGWYGQMETSN